MEVEVNLEAVLNDVDDDDDDDDDDEEDDDEEEEEDDRSRLYSWRELSL